MLHETGDQATQAAEQRRLDEDHRREGNWKRWGPYLAERQWGTVREDYSPGGDAWEYLTHDQARSRAYRWGEDGLMGICDRQGRLCFALALWNGEDPILKERLFGLTGPDGNHGEDVKEAYFFMDSTDASYMRALYKYPLTAFPYERLLHENRRRGLLDREFELEDTGAFDDGPYADVVVEYAKGAPDDVLVRVTIANRGDTTAHLAVLPTLWFRNTWSWGRTTPEYSGRPTIRHAGAGRLAVEHPTLGSYVLSAAPGPAGPAPGFLFTENDTNTARLFDTPNATPYVKDAFHEYIVNGRSGAVNPRGEGTKAAAVYRLVIPPRAEVTLRLRLTARPAEGLPSETFGEGFEATFAARRREADEFYDGVIPAAALPEERNVMRQAYAGLLWSKQFYHYDLRGWLEGDPAQPPPAAARRDGRNAGWTHLYNRDVISMPDTWEYPWYAAWDLAFHMIPFARIDPEYAKAQLVLFLREWYMHPNGQLPAYEWNLSDVNPPVHAWACWRVYKMTGEKGRRDRTFLSRVFQKLLINFTWWVNRKDEEGNNLFAGGFLGLDNIGVFDRSKPLPTGGHLEQADGTAWMAFYCATMLSMALELAREDPAYEDMASKFLEHYVAIAEALNSLGGGGLWSEEDGFWYDQLHVRDLKLPLGIRSMVGLVPLLAVEVLEDVTIDRLPAFKKRMQWFLDNRPEVARHILRREPPEGEHHGHRLLALASRTQLERVLGYLLDEEEFLSPHGIRSLSRYHREHPYSLQVDGTEYRVDYDPAEGTSRLFGGNSNWRGPVWFPLNFLIVEALERYHHFYGGTLRVECPTRSGRRRTLRSVAGEIATRLGSLFLPDASGQRPCHGGDRRFADDPHWRDLVLFHEYFDGDDGRGAGATHQTGWTALAVSAMEDTIKARVRAAAKAAAAREGAP